MNVMEFWWLGPVVQEYHSGGEIRSDETPRGLDPGGGEWIVWVGLKGSGLAWHWWWWMDSWGRSEGEWLSLTLVVVNG